MLGKPGVRERKKMIELPRLPAADTKIDEYPRGRLFALQSPLMPLTGHSKFRF
jgi:hypothetical protein